MMDQKLEAFARILKIMDELREQCPWDIKQTMETLRPLTIEETYELGDAILQADMKDVKEELGDLLLQVVFHCQLARERGAFDFEKVAGHIRDKLLRRHPHVFGEEASRAAGNQADVDAAVEGSSAAVLRNWEEIKAAERQSKPSASAAPPSRLDGVQRAMPALAEAAKLGGKAQKAGFDWPHWRDLLPKLVEETAELEAEASSDDPARKPFVEAELGDLLFTVVNLGRHLGVDAEMALRGCNQRFRSRFHQMELASSRPLEELSPPELEELWAGAKRKLAAEAKSAPEPRA